MPKTQTTPERFADFIYNSNLIEGIPELDYWTILRDTKKLMEEEKQRTHVGALAYIYDLAKKQKNFHLSDLLKIHEKIASEQLVLGHPIQTKHVGNLRDCLVRIGLGTIPPPRKENLSKFFHGFNRTIKNINSKNLFSTLSEWHLIYERIHPFADGNGRTGRLLIAYQFFFAQFAGKLSKRLKLPVILDSKKQQYYQAFQFYETDQKELAIKKLAGFLEKSV